MTENQESIELEFYKCQKGFLLVKIETNEKGERHATRALASNGNLVPLDPQCTWVMHCATKEELIRLFNEKSNRWKINYRIGE